MTAIIGIIDTDGSVFMGGDTCGTNKAGDQDIYANKKVFSPAHSPDFIVGVCGSFRLGQVLRYHFKAPKPLPGPDHDFESYVATELSESLYGCFKKAGLFDESIGEGIDGSFLLGYQGNLVHVQENLQALISRKPYAAIGSGSEIAKGALFASIDEKNIGDRVYLALRAAAEFSALVREPFDVMRLDFDPDWKASKGKRKRGKKAK